MTTYPPPPSEPDRPGGEGWSPNADSAPGEPPRPETPQGPPPGGSGPAMPNLPPAPPPPGGPGAAPPPPALPPYGGGPAQEPRNGLGKAALVCGILAVVLSFIPGVNWFTWPLGVLAIVFGAIGWSRANKGQATNKPFAITGLVLGIASFFTFCLIYIILGAGSSTMYYNTMPM